MPIAIPKLQANCVSSHLHATYLPVTITQITALIVDNTFVSLPRLIPSAMSWLGPSFFLCHQKWESYLKLRFQTLPFGGGVNQADAEAQYKHPNSRRRCPRSCSADCVTKLRPRSQMEELWAITHNRGQGDDAAAAGSRKFPGSARGSAEDNDEDVDEKKDDGPEPDNLKVLFNLVSHVI